MPAFSRRWTVRRSVLWTWSFPWKNRSISFRLSVTVEGGEPPILPAVPGMIPRSLIPARRCLGFWSGRAGQSDCVAADMVADRQPAPDLLQTQDFRTSQHLGNLQIDVRRRRLGDLEFPFRLGVADADVEHEAIELGLGQ